MAPLPHVVTRLLSSSPSGCMRYLHSALPDCVDELLDDQVDAFETWFLQLNDLLFHYGLERQVWGEQARPEGSWEISGAGRSSGHFYIRLV